VAESPIRRRHDERALNTVLQPPGWPRPKGFSNGMLARGEMDIEEYLADLDALGAAYREVMGRHFPAMAVVEVTRLVEPLARLEIEATAVLPG
jgi:hypothetical protein